MVFRRQLLARIRPGLTGLLVLALLSFAHTCAVRGGECDGPVATVVDHCADEPDHAADGACSGHDCDHQPGSCSHETLCCSTWAPAPPTITLAAPAMLVLAPVAEVVSLSPRTVFAAGLEPIPSESPPPLISFLRI